MFQFLMKTVIIFLLSSLAAFGQGINFSAQPQTNNFRGGDLFLIDSVVSGGTGYSSRAAYLSNIFQQFVVSSNYATVTFVTNYVGSTNTFIIRDIPLASFPRGGTNIAHGLVGTNITFLQGWIYVTNKVGDNSAGLGTVLPNGLKLKFESVFATSGETPFFTYGCDSNNIFINVTTTAQLRVAGSGGNTYVSFNNTNWNVMLEAKAGF